MTGKRFDRREVICGAVVVLVALLFLYEASGYDLGTARRMGPGFFPLLIGALLLICGFGIVVFDARSPSSSPKEGKEGAPPPSGRALFFLLLSVLAFGALVTRLGLVPATFGTVLLASLADPRLGVARGVLIAVIMAALCWLIFIMGLDMRVRAFQWVI